MLGLNDIVVVFAIAGDVLAASVTVPENPPVLCTVTRDVVDEPCWRLRLDGLAVMLRSGVEPFDILHAESGCSSHEEYP